MATWHNNGLVVSFKALGSALTCALRGMYSLKPFVAPNNTIRPPKVYQQEFNLTPQEIEAERLDNGDLEGYYRADERNVALFQQVYYSQAQGAWVARFIPARPENAHRAHCDNTYAEILRRARLLHDGRVKPSQSFKALTALDVRFDQAVKLLPPIL